VSGKLHILSAFIDNATHWRCVVVGDRVVASYINPPDGQDFRTYGTSDPDEVFTSVDEEMESLAIRAVHALGVSLGGVDILQHPSGRLYVLEANFPCYYAHAQQVAGIDVAGSMLEFLLAQSAAAAR
jgi:ribosomal protein S6--L-glutamate ligase